ncbi:MAG TPA: hypothetical protein VFZ91_02860 [Allosphingosinicella sp.]
MAEDSTPRAAATPIPAFAPVPVRARRDGWTAGRQRAFIAALARIGCVGRAAVEAGMSRESAYRLRRRKGATSFAAAWDSIFAARPRGTTSFELIWHRIVRRAVGPGAAVRRDAAVPADRFEALQRRIRGLAGGGGPRERSQ